MVMTEKEYLRVMIANIAVERDSIRCERQQAEGKESTLAGYERAFTNRLRELESLGL